MGGVIPGGRWEMCALALVGVMMSLPGSDDMVAIMGAMRLGRRYVVGLAPSILRGGKDATPGDVGA